MEEVWTPIRGYENYYEVSNYGRVRSLDRVLIRKDGRFYRRSGQIIKPQKNKQNCLLQVMLLSHSRCRLFYVHRLVAEAFLEEPRDKNARCVTHLDGNPHNNYVGNLKYVTLGECQKINKEKVQ